MTDDLQVIASDLNLSTAQIEKTIQLLDDGNTIPFITRFRKDETGGLKASQIQSIQFAINKVRGLQERKSFVTKSIDSQGKLTDELKSNIEQAKTSRELEDLYLPFKPKQESLALTARQQGLEPLANDVYEGDRPDVDLATRSTDFVRVDKNLNSVDEVIAGVGHILAERFSEQSDLRNKLRQIVLETGRLVVSTIEQQSDEQPSDEQSSANDDASAPSQSDQQKANAKSENETVSVAADGDKVSEPDALNVQESQVESDAGPSEAAADAGQAEPSPPNDVNSAPDEAPQVVQTPEVDAAAPQVDSVASGDADSGAAESNPTTKVELPKASEDDSSGQNPETAQGDNTTVPGAGEATADDLSPATLDAADPIDPTGAEPPKASATEEGSEPTKKKRKKKPKKKKVEHPFKEYANFNQPIGKIPHYRLLAINRGERSGLLNVKIEANQEKLKAITDACVPADHPFANFLKDCIKDSLHRLILPSLEREVRRELTETAEQHAVRVFALNLRNLLLQPPVRNKRILAIDPGYKRGCTIVVLNGLGRLLESERMAVVGNQTKKDDSRRKIASLVKKHDIDVIVIGNGTACRQTEEIVSLTLENELAGEGIQYVIVNEAGASYYSTSEAGAQDLPDETPLVRSAISVGRRLINPLAELVKISPANIGVGLYQHDIKSKHLADSLVEVVRDCVNMVGVDVNSASPALLSHVAGLNQLTARRIVDHRNENGPFKNREELKKVSGIGEATFVQAAGFLRVYGSDNPLDETQIHPESYGLAHQILSKANATADQLPTRKRARIVITPVSKPSETEATTSEAPVASSTDSGNEPDSSPVESISSDDGKPANDSTSTSESVVESPTSNDPNEANTTLATASEPIKLDPEVAPTESSDESDSKPEAEAQVTETGTTSATAEKPVEVVSVIESPVEETPASKQLKEALSGLNAAELASEFSVGKMLLTDVLRALRNPSYDPRQNLDAPIFRTGIVKVEELKPEMKLPAQVVNVVDFGVFVDIGLGVSCLVHISQLSNRFMKDLHQHYVVGDRLNVWVKDVDLEKRRVQLTAVAPGGKRPARPPRRKPGRRGEPVSRQQGGGRQGSGGKKNFRRDRKPSKPRQPAKPITDEMLAGDKPMRSFSDLAQFFDKSKDKKK